MKVFFSTKLCPHPFTLSSGVFVPGAVDPVHGPRSEKSVYMQRKKWIFIALYMGIIMHTCANDPRGRPPAALALALAHRVRTILYKQTQEQTLFNDLRHWQDTEQTD